MPPDGGTGHSPAWAHRPVRVFWCSVCRRRGLPYRHRETEEVFRKHLRYQVRFSMRAEPPTLGEVFARLVEEG